MKKLLALALAAMMMSCLAACGSKNEPAQEKQSETQAAVPQVDGAIGSAEAPVQVKVVIKDVFPDEEDVMALEAAIEEKMAARNQYIDLVFQEPPASGYNSAMPLAIMNGEVDADLIYLQGGDQPLADQGLLEEIGRAHV